MSARRIPGQRAMLAVRGRVRSRTAPHGEIIVGAPGERVIFSLVPGQPDEPDPALRLQLDRSIMDLPLPALLEAVASAAEPGYDDEFGKPLVPCDVVGPDGQVTAGSGETWGNDRFTVHVQRFAPVDADEADESCPMVLSVHTHNRDPQIPWRLLQRIKNEIAGPGRWAAEWFPDEAQLVDEANERHLWVMPAEFEPPQWMACSGGRMVGNTEQAAAVGAEQSPLPAWYPEANPGGQQ